MSGRLDTPPPKGKVSYGNDDNLLRYLVAFAILSRAIAITGCCFSLDITAN